MHTHAHQQGQPTRMDVAVLTSPSQLRHLGVQPQVEQSAHFIRWHFSHNVSLGGGPSGKHVRHYQASHFPQVVVTFPASRARRDHGAGDTHECPSRPDDPPGLRVLSRPAPGRGRTALRPRAAPRRTAGTRPWPSGAAVNGCSTGPRPYGTFLGSGRRQRRCSACESELLGSVARPTGFGHFSGQRLSMSLEGS